MGHERRRRGSADRLFRRFGPDRTPSAVPTRRVACCATGGKRATVRRLAPRSPRRVCGEGSTTTPDRRHVRRKRRPFRDRDSHAAQSAPRNSCLRIGADRWSPARDLRRPAAAIEGQPLDSCSGHPGANGAAAEAVREQRGAGAAPPRTRGPHADAPGRQGVAPIPSPILSISAVDERAGEQLLGMAERLSRLLGVPVTRSGLVHATANLVSSSGRRRSGLPARLRPLAGCTTRPGDAGPSSRRCVSSRAADRGRSLAGHDRAWTSWRGIISTYCKSMGDDLSKQIDGMSVLLCSARRFGRSRDRRSRRCRQRSSGKSPVLDRLTQELS